jgi:hypothetical protein
MLLNSEKFQTMVASENTDLNQLNDRSETELKQILLQMTQGRDKDALRDKVQFYKEKLAPIVEKLSHHNPLPIAEEQVRFMSGIWSPIWSTIPFLDIIPGRLPSESYQIFYEDGYYANIARYAPFSNTPLLWLQKLTSFFLAYDLMVLQRFEVKDGRWQIHNVGIKQALRLINVPLTAEKADQWFTKVIQSRSARLPDTEQVEAPQLQNLNQATAKKLEAAFLAVPQFEHLYIDRDFRLTKTQRDAKQRPSYTIAVRH